PRVVALLLWLTFLCRVPPGAFAIGVDLDVGGGAEGEPLAARPRIILALVDRRIVVAIVLRQREHAKSFRVTIRAGEYTREVAWVRDPELIAWVGSRQIVVHDLA